jgi:hypothetical protein
MPSVSIAFSYTNDPLVLAAFGEFHVYAVDPSTKARQGPALVVKTAPTITAPLVLSINGYGSQMVEVVPADKDLKEGVTAYAPVYIPLPPVSAIAQVTR